VVDVETTGFSPRLHDRIIEIAIVRTSPSGTIEDTWTTLLNPGRDLGPTHIHGIRGADVRNAPRFVDVAGDIAARLDGAVLVAHNARFDLGFLAFEYALLGAAVADWPALCTLALSYRLGCLGGGRLGACCVAEGIPLVGAHSALGDASATAALLAAYLGRATEFGMHTLTDLGCVPLSLADLTWAPWPVTGYVSRRNGIAPSDTPRLAEWVRHLPAHDLRSTTTAADTAAYLDVLDRAMEDRLLTEGEVQVLRETADAWGLTRSDVERAHLTYVSALAATALADGVVTEFEAHDLELVAAALGLDGDAVTAELDRSPKHTLEPFAPGLNSLRGVGVCFTGALQARFKGQAITRDLAQQLARAAGLVVHERVTKALELLVVADPDSLSEKADKARAYGTRIMAEAAFWKAINVSTT
jgi:DNA polymerase-3 subunit epsilon